jgi:ABC-type polysaccharide/polyol phosphate transport system ATPase subunit
MGYSKEFLDEKYQSIVDFSEIGDFINMPLKNYSSGMVSRIAFSIATAVHPDILIADEILSVGDFLFQEKCMKRIHGLMEEGTTVLLVSHSIDQIRNTCNRATWIERGKQMITGNVNEVCDAYTHIRDGKM